ncbi:MAG: histidine kinase [Chloroflexi bacterium]|nr:MAG: histidine kinase [Chloroflexota bacterium]RLC85755.1 MAG: histidine kinase [Chloroflexota bacterium]
MARIASGSVMIATIGRQAQVVTFALDDLLRRGEVIHEVIVVHLSPQAEPRTGQALVKLTAEFPDDYYDHAGQSCRLRFFPIREGSSKLDDIRDHTAVNAAWSAIYELIASLKTQGRHLHVCISGGRRMLALLAMSAAMLHFDHRDRLWHMYTPSDFLERARNGAIMHACPEDGVRLLQVPLVPWGTYLPALRTLAQAAPMEIVAAQTRWLDSTERARCQAATEQLTPRQLDVLRAFAAGQSPQEVAESLCVTVKTVHAHKTVILSECRNGWELPKDARLDYHFLREKFGRYF